MIKKLILTIVLIAFSFLVYAPTTSAGFNPLSSSCSGAGASSPVCQDAAKKGGKDPVAGPGGIIQKVANIIAIIAGIAAVVMIIISGLTLASSGGSNDKVTASRKRLVGAVIGLLIVALAWAITSFVINKLILA